nr:MAG TPA: hypothetical protein [Bacteriophage sp.]
MKAAEIFCRGWWALNYLPPQPVSTTIFERYQSL